MIIGLVVGGSLMAIGASIFLSGIGQPVYCGGGGRSGDGGCGNIPLVAGAFIMLAAIATLAGSIIYAFRAWQDSDSSVVED